MRKSKSLLVLNFRAAAFEPNLDTLFRAVIKSSAGMPEHFYEHSTVLGGNHEISRIRESCRFYLIMLERCMGVFRTL